MRPEVGILKPSDVGRGGRVMSTSLSALTLEVYYRYLPLYKLDKESGAGGAAVKPAAAKPAAVKPAGKDVAKPAKKDAK